MLRLQAPLIHTVQHPAQVRGSSVESRRAFLAEKGLTGSEIDEAFRRVPDAPSASVPPSATGLPVAPAALAPQKPYPTSGGGAVADTLAQLQAMQAPPPPQPIRWTQVRCCLLLLLQSLPSLPCWLRLSLPMPHHTAYSLLGALQIICHVCLIN